MRDEFEYIHMASPARLAEMLENVTDAHKKISDRVRNLLLNYLSD